MTHALPLLLALACASDPTAGQPDAEAVQTVELESLQPAEAVRIEGKRVRFRVGILAVVFGRQKAERSFRLVAPRDVKALMDNPGLPLAFRSAVEAELRVEYVPPVFQDGVLGRAGWVYRLDKPTIVGP